MSSDTSRRAFAELFGGRPGDSDMATLARAAARSGYAVLPIAPGAKTPLCPLTPRQRAAADKEAAHAARDAGRTAWERVRHPCGIEHATTDPKLAHRWFKRLAAERPDLNLAVSVGASQALVADADTADELASFTTLWARKEDNPDLIRAAPTVRSPGERDEDGHWKHSEGGHYWFLLPPDVDFGDLAGTTSIPVGTDDEHPAQLKVSGYVLVPPSVRAEGPYVMASDAHMAPAWLVELVQDYVAHRRETRSERRDRALDADDQIRLAQSAISWAAILVPRGWMDSGKASRCGCPEWTAPGDHSSPKSATAHDPGCGEFDTSDGFIHVWTDNPPGWLAAANTKTFSKIQFVAWHDFDGDNAAAMAELDIERRTGDGPAEIDDSFLDRIRTADHGGQEDEDSDDEDDEDEEPEPEHTSWWFKDLGPVLSGENPEPEPEVLSRDDGLKLFYPGKVNGLIGESESGKSWIALAAVAEELHAGRSVCYFDFEDSAAGIVSRLRAIGVPDELLAPDRKLFGYVGPEESLHQLAKVDFADVLTDRSWSLIVFDGVNAAMTQINLDLISNTDATKFFAAVTRPASLRGAAVLTIDHVPKDTERKTKGGIGAQAKRATITGSCIAVEVIEPFARGKSGSLALTVDKDRPGYVRGASNAAQDWATALISSGEDGAVSIKFEVPQAVSKATGETDEKAHEMRIKVIEYLREHADFELSGRHVTENVTGNSERIRNALVWLAENGFVSRRLDGKTQLHRYARDYPDGPTEVPDPDADDEPP